MLQWRSGRFAGLGMERFADGTLFIGDYEDGLADGSGVAIYLDGSMHEGQFAAGRVSAPGCRIACARMESGSEAVDTADHCTLHAPWCYLQLPEPAATL